MSIELSIVCLGKWNKRIFTPAWISSNVLKNDPKNPIEGTINPVDIEITYAFKGIAITAKDHSLDISIIDAGNKTEEKINLATEIFNQILKLLPQTPINAVGFNFKVVINKDTPETPFISKIKKSFIGLDAEFRPSNFKYSNKLSDNKVLNYIIEQKNEQLIITINLHYNKLGEDLFKPILLTHYNQSKALVYG